MKTLATIWLTASALIFAVLAAERPPEPAPRVAVVRLKSPGLITTQNTAKIRDFMLPRVENRPGRSPPQIAARTLPQPIRNPMRTAAGAITRSTWTWSTSSMSKTMVAISKELMPHCPPPVQFAAVAVASLPMEKRALPPRVYYSPAAEVKAAAQDALSPHWRYVSMGHLPPEYFGRCIVAVNHALQDTSRVRQITPCVQISPTVLRIDAAAYCNDSTELDQWESAWGQLAATDPYFSITTQVLAHPKITPQTVTVAGGWTGLDGQAALRTRTSTPQFGAMVRADWFVANVLFPPNYYRFAGLEATEAAFVRQFGIDPGVIQRLEANVGANIFTSGVTLQDRRVVWSGGPLGGYYETLDSITADAAHGVFYRPISADGSAVKYDAKEVFAMAANGFYRTIIFDSAGVRQDVVNPKIVCRDTVIADLGSKDTQIYAARNCILCHTENGLNTIQNDQYDQYHTKRGTASLSSYDPAYVRRTVAFYDDPRLQRQMKFDRDTHEVAVNRACGCTAAMSIQAMGEIIKRSTFDSVTPQIAADEIGVSVEELREVIGTTNDPYLGGLHEGKAIARKSYESCYPELAVKRAAWSHP